MNADWYGELASQMEAWRSFLEEGSGIGAVQGMLHHRWVRGSPHELTAMANRAPLQVELGKCVI